MYNKDNRFDIDLAYGQLGESFLGQCLSVGSDGGGTIEVKTERGLWKSTGNIAIEYESRGKKSGILSTKSTYWFHLLSDSEGNIEGGFIFPTKQLLSWLVANKESLRKVNGGDDYTSKLLLVPIRRLHEVSILL